VITITPKLVEKRAVRNLEKGTAAKMEMFK